MSNKTTVIAHLNKVLANELVAINQYFLHGRMMQDQGFNKLGQATYAESIDEMKHADQLVTRILALKGLPNMQDLGKLTIGETIPEMIALDLKLEEKAIPELITAIEACEKAKDFTSRQLLESILASEEAHLEFLQTQLHLIHTIGEQNYLQSQI